MLLGLLSGARGEGEECIVFLIFFCMFFNASLCMFLLVF